MRPLKNSCEVAVIGGGVAGLSAARHAARLGRLVTLFEPAGLYGGQVATVGEVEGLPVPGRFSGQDIALYLLAEARRAQVQVVETGVARIDLEGSLRLTDQEGAAYRPEAIIIASGASPRHLGVPGEDEFAGRGVSRCATCDGGFFRGEHVVVVGGGDSAAQEALVLARTSRRVTLVCRSPLKAKRDYVDRLASQENIGFVWDSELTAVLGEDGVSGVRLRNVRDGATSEVACTGLFPFIGAIPNTAFAPSALLGAAGRIQTRPDHATIDPRVFAIGAASSAYGGDIVQALAQGVEAAEAAARRFVH
jgi:thioredoxin reductase (NADPH)